MRVDVPSTIAILTAIALGATLVTLGLQRASVGAAIAIVGPVLCILAVVFIFGSRPRPK